MATDMRKTHSYPKGLAETRARAGGAPQRLKQLRSEVQRKLKVAKADVVLVHPARALRLAAQ